MLVRCARNAKDELTASELKLEGVEVSFGSYDTRHLEKGASVCRLRSNTRES